jgi:hypothetical protein
MDYIQNIKKHCFKVGTPYRSNELGSHRSQGDLLSTTTHGGHWAASLAVRRRIEYKEEEEKEGEEEEL